MRKIRLLPLFLLVTTAIQTTYAQQNEYIMDPITKTALPVVCKLTDKDFRQRLDSLRLGIFNKTKQINELPDGYEYIFDEEAEFYRTLTEFILYERQCCPFFHFSLHFEPAGGAVRLRLYGSTEIKQMLSSLITRSELKDKVKKDLP